MRIAELSVRRPVMTFMLLVSLVVMGAISVLKLPLAFLPEVDFPQIFINAPYPNSSPSQVQRQIVKPLEEALATLSGVKKMRSTSEADGGSIQLEFNWGQSLDIVRMKVGEKVDQVRKDLPADLERIDIVTFSTSQIPVVEARISAPGVDLSRNYDLLEQRVINPIRRVPGVAKVELDGVAPREVRIDLILDKIKAHNLDVGALAQRLQGSNLNVAVGRLVDGNRVYHVRTFGAFEDLEAIANLPIDAGRAPVDSSADGARAGSSRPLRLRDIAELRYEEPVIPYGRHLNRKFAAALNVFKEPTANTVDVATRVTKVIKEDIPRDPTLAGINFFVFQDQAEQILNGIHGLQEAGFYGGLLAVSVLYLFLRRFDTTFIVSLAIPISIIVSCAVLFFLGKNLNILSMMGLMLGVGLLVDDAIVVLESIFRFHAQMNDAPRAAVLGTKSVFMAVVAATVTTGIVFLPLIVGERSELQTWLSEIGITISLTIFCSLLVSLTLIPLMASRLLSRRPHRNPQWIAWLTDRYVDVIGWTFRHRVATFFITIAVLASIALPFKLGLETAIFSGGKNDRLFIQYEFKDFHYKEDGERVVNRVEEMLYQHEGDIGIESVYSRFGENEAFTLLRLLRKDLKDEQIKALRKRIRAWLPVVPGVKLRFGDDDAAAGGSTTSFAVNLFGDDTRLLERIAREVELRVARISGIQDVRASDREGRQEVQVSLDPNLSSKYGLSPRDLAQTFGFTLGGVRLRKYRAGDKEVNVILSLRRKDVERADDLKKLMLTGGTGTTLGNIADFKIVRSPKAITRENRKTRLSVTGTFEGKSFGEAQTAMQRTLDAMVLPTGYSWSFGERVMEQQQQNKQMVINALLACALVYVVMAALFESIAHPIAILIAIPFALFGAVWFDLATATPFNLMAHIGVLILMGIVVKNGIVLIDHVNTLRREGLSRDQAIITGGRERMRPILMTAATAVLGLVPLAVGGSGIADVYYYPLARTVIGGLTTSTVLTLVILPYIYTLVDDLALWGRRVWRAAVAPPIPAAPALDGAQASGS